MAQRTTSPTPGSSLLLITFTLALCALQLPTLWFEPGTTSLLAFFGSCLLAVVSISDFLLSRRCPLRVRARRRDERK